MTKPKINGSGAAARAHVAACASSQRLARSAHALQHELETRKDGVPVEELDAEDSLITDIRAFTTTGSIPKIRDKG